MRKRKTDFSDVDTFIRQGKEEVRREMDLVGRKAVSYAKATGNYQDHTGRLRASNTYKVEGDVLTIGNNAEYASYVESKGFTVVSAAALFAEQQLKERFER